MMLTPRELFAFCKGAENRRAHEWRLAMAGAWSSANFARAKKLPDLSRILRRIGPKRPMPEQTPEYQLQLVTFLNAAWGGRDLRPAEH